MWHDTNLYRDDSEYDVPCSPSKISNSKNVEAVPINLYLLSNKAENQDSFLGGVRFRNSICQTQGGLINQCLYTDCEEFVQLYISGVCGCFKTASVYFYNSGH